MFDRPYLYVSVVLTAYSDRLLMCAAWCVGTILSAASLWLGSLMLRYKAQGVGTLLWHYHINIFCEQIIKPLNEKNILKIC